MNILFLTLFLISFGAKAQEHSATGKVTTDSLKNKPLKVKISSSKLEIIDTAFLKLFRPSPMKVVWMGAVIPGYGQIMNKKYWKLPIVYGGFLGCAYAVTWNSGKYQSYKNAYADITDSDPTTNSFLEIIPKGYTIDSPGIGGISTWTNTLKIRQDSYRRNRDLSIIISIGVYALTLVDAYVDAQLYDFDISPDLSMRFQPTLLENENGCRNTLGMQCCIRLK